MLVMVFPAVEDPFDFVFKIVVDFDWLGWGRRVSMDFVCVPWG